MSQWNGFQWQIIQEKEIMCKILPYRHSVRSYYLSKEHSTQNSTKCNLRMGHTTGHSYILLWILWSLISTKMQILKCNNQIWWKLLSPVIRSLWNAIHDVWISNAKTKGRLLNSLMEKWFLFRDSVEPSHVLKHLVLYWQLCGQRYFLISEIHYLQ